MEQVVEIFNKVAATSKKNEKVEILKELPEIGKMLCIEALSPYRVFGVKKYPMPDSYATEDEDVILFQNLLNTLHNREVTGNKAIALVTATLGLYTEATAEVFHRVLQKDLRMGASAKSVNKAHPDLVPTFEVMLAGKMDGKFKWDEGPWSVELKYDGKRVIATCRDGEVFYQSRSGKEADHLIGLFDEELRLMEERAGYPIIVDGEEFGKDFTDTIKAKGKDNVAGKKNLVLYAFDVIPLDTWDAQSASTVSQKDRSELLDRLTEGNKKVVASKRTLCHTQEEVEAIYKDYVLQDEEGVIVKSLEGLYEWKRSKNWTKYKVFYNFDGEIVDLEKGTDGKKNANSLGAIVIEGEDENGTKFKARCGIGFSAELRDEIWNNPGEYIGRMVEVKAMGLCLAEKATLHSLRIPAFIGFREDKD